MQSKKIFSTVALLKLVSILFLSSKTTMAKKIEKTDTIMVEEGLTMLEEDETFWGRQLRGGTGASMSMMPSSCVCDVCPDGEVCDEAGLCAREPYSNDPFRLGDDYTCTETDLSGCHDSQTSTACWIPQCNVADGICEYTNQRCPQDCPDLCEENTLVSRCGCVCFPKRCPIDGYVCDSSDGCCKDPSDIQ